jgi:hypothetical protein
MNIKLYNALQGLFGDRAPDFACPQGKCCFYNREEAEEEAYYFRNRNAGGYSRAYRCHLGAHWHTTSQPYRSKCRFSRS